MKSLLRLCVVLVFLPATIFSQTLHTLTGRVTDENNLPLPGANVYITPVKKGAVTDRKGNFEFLGLPAGKYIVEISFLGYKKFADTIDLGIVHNLSVKLKSLPQTLNEVIVTGNHAEFRKKEESLNIEIVNDDYLKQNLGSSLMNSLERLPGVTTIDIGSGQSKPVIRGLGFNRVVVVENDIKHEAQQWGADHGLEIDQYAIDNVEIIKGPASLMYGSDAMGGVIDMKNRKLPADSTYGGSVDLSGKTNNDFVGTSVSLYGRKKCFFADFRATILDYGDYKVPTDSVDIYSYRAPLYKNHLRNTAGKEQNLHLTFGIIKTKFQSRFYISNVYSKNGFFANAHGLEPRNVDTELHDKSSRDIQYPYQQVNHFKVINTSQYNFDKAKIETDFGFQRNFRQEWSQYVSHGYMPATYPTSLNANPDLELQFDKYVYSGNLKFSYKINDKVQFNSGINSDYQDNRIDGRGFIIPAYKQLNLGAYLLGKYVLSGKSIIQMGVRYDFGNIKTQAYSDWFPSPVVSNNDTTFQHLQRAGNINRNFPNVSWSLGYNYNAEKWSFKANLGKSFRMPTAKELAANGVNYHNFSYEVGDAGLLPEVSYQLDVGLEYNSSDFAIGVTPFLNYFTNYIYLNPSSEHDRLYGNGNQVFYYMQCEVLRYGAEIHAHYQLLRPLQVGLIGEFVYSEQQSGKKKGFTLPFSPPASAILNVKYQKQKIKCIKNAYLSVDYKFTAPQNNIVPPEETTDSYRVINIGLGGDLKLKNQKISISLQVQNLLNTKYFNHTSYYRLINVPEPGRNLIMNISIPFSGKIKRK
jgi:iron complex outermembrane receptor protein